MEDVINYIDRLQNCGLGKDKSLKYLLKFVSFIDAFPITIKNTINTYLNTNNIGKKTALNNIKDIIIRGIK